MRFMAQSESMIHESMELTRRRMENPIRVLRAKAGRRHVSTAPNLRASDTTQLSRRDANVRHRAVAVAALAEGCRRPPGAGPDDTA